MQFSVLLNGLGYVFVVKRPVTHRWNCKARIAVLGHYQPLLTEVGTFPPAQRTKVL